jgi:hypothetical protein
VKTEFRKSEEAMCFFCFGSLFSVTITDVTLYDRDIREPLFDCLETRASRLRILEEVTIGKSRADAVLVEEDGLCGIEIKSDADTYTRLRGQIREYNRYFDRNLLVVGTRHAVHCAEHVPEWWGILTAEWDHGTVDFYEYRKPLPNPKVKLEKQITLLWRPELAELQRRFGLSKYTGKSKQFVQQKLLERVEAGLLHQGITELLLERDYTLIEAEIESFRNRHQG